MSLTVKICGLRTAEALDAALESGADLVGFVFFPPSPRNLGLEVSEVVGRVESALTALGIGHLAPRDPLRLSGGQAQLVALASVLALRPAALALDEPTSQLDPAGTRLVGDARAAGAIGACLSGAGSAILAFTDTVSGVARIESAFRAAAADTDLPGRVEVVAPRNAGAKVLPSS